MFLSLGTILNLPVCEPLQREGNGEQRSYQLSRFRSFSTYAISANSDR
jgi:hypothetical protein